MNNNFRRFAALSAALIMSCSSFSCSDKPKKKEGVSVTVTQTMYKDERKALPEDCVQPLAISYAEEKCRIIYKDIENKMKLCIMNDSFEAESTVTLYEGDTVHYCADFLDDGSVMLLVITSDYEIADDSAEAYKDFIKNAELNFSLMIYNGSGELTSELEIEGMDEYYSLEYSDCRKLMKYGESDFIIDIFTGLVQIDSHGKVRDYSERNWEYVGQDSAGNVIQLTYQGYGFMDGKTLKTPSEMIPYGEDMFLQGSPFAGSGGFTAFFGMSDGIYGLTADGQLMIVTDYVSSAITGGEISKIAAAGENRFVAISSGRNGKRMLSVLTVRPDEYTDNREKVVLGEFGADSAEEDMIVEFNRSSEKFYIESKGYAFESFAEDVQKDILTGEGPDILAYTDVSDMHRLQNMGALADLYSLMDKYDGVNADDFLPNVIGAFETDGGLYGMSKTMHPIMYVANGEIIPEEYSDWTFDEFYELYENRPNDMYLSFDMEMITPEDVFSAFGYLNLSCWVDYEKSECYFDSEEFIRLLEFCRDIEYPPELNEEYMEQSIYESVDMERELSIMNQKAMLGRFHSTDFRSMGSMLAQKGMTMSNSTFLNIPGDSGGTFSSGKIYSIIENADCTDGAWEVFDYIMCEENQDYGAELGMFMTNKASFEKAAASCIDNGKEHKGIGSIGDYTYEYNPLITEEEADILSKFALNCSNLHSHDYKINEICTDEFGRFINDEISAEECAEMIQNRVQLLLSETS